MSSLHPRTRADLENQLAIEWPRLRGRLYSLAESWGLPREQETAVKAFFKGWTLDHQERFRLLLEADEVATAAVNLTALIEELEGLVADLADDLALTDDENETEHIGFAIGVLRERLAELAEEQAELENLMALRADLERASS